MPTVNVNDYVFTNHYSLWLVHPQNEDAREWLEEHVSDEAQWIGGTLAVEPRYVTGLAEGLQLDGYRVSF